jgi:predicted ATPase
LLDEPEAALSPQRQSAFLRVIRELTAFSAEAICPIASKIAPMCS